MVIAWTYAVFPVCWIPVSPRQNSFSALQEVYFSPTVKGHQACQTIKFGMLSN